MLTALHSCCIICFQVPSLSLPNKRSVSEDLAVGLELIPMMKLILLHHSTIKTLSTVLLQLTKLYVRASQLLIWLCFNPFIRRGGQTGFSLATVAQNLVGARGKFLSARSSAESRFYRNSEIEREKDLEFEGYFVKLCWLSCKALILSFFGIITLKSDVWTICLGI